MGTAAIPDAEPLPPLSPTTVSRRWPWLLATLALTATASVLSVRTIIRGLQIGGDSDGGEYTAWVYRPLAGAFFLASASGVVTTIALCFPRWKQRTRAVFFAVFVGFSLVVGLLGEHESAARRHIGPQLAATVDAFKSPVGATPAGPAVVSSDGAFPLDDLLGEPSASKSWRLPTDSDAAACAAVNQMIAGERGWKPDAGSWCGFERRQGRIFIRISDNQLGSKAGTIEVSAFPTDGWNY